MEKVYCMNASRCLSKQGPKEVEDVYLEASILLQGPRARDRILPFLRWCEALLPLFHDRRNCPLQIRRREVLECRPLDLVTLRLVDCFVCDRIDDSASRLVLKCE
jgi:hypothetical protein